MVEENKDPIKKEEAGRFKTRIIEKPGGVIVEAEDEQTGKKIEWIISDDGTKHQVEPIPKNN